MKWPNLKHLQYLVTLHQEQHFHKAATRCHVSQSTLSTAIQTLEEDFGCQLLEREHKKFVFTPFGHQLVEKSKSILSQAQELVDFAQSHGDWRTGILKVGVIPTIAPFLFSPLIALMKQHLPNIQLQLQEDTTANLLALLQEGQLDLLVLALPMDTPGCKQMVIGRDPFHLVGHQSLMADIKAPLDITSLPKESIFLLQQEHCMTEHAVSACGLKHAKQVSSLTASSLHTLVQLASNKMGFTFLPELALNSHMLKDIPLTVMPAEKNAYREIGLVWRNGTTRMQLFRFIATLLAPSLPISTLE